MADRMERLTELVMFLLGTEARSFEDIVRETDLYDDVGDAARRAFERDKTTLREAGVPLDVEWQTGQHGSARYRIRPEDYFLPDLHLTDAERVALHLAASSVVLEADWDEAALLRLGDASVTPMPVVADLPTLDALPDLHQAMLQRSVASFDYGGRRRQVEPLGVFYRRGQWYVGVRDDGATKVFRIDRIEGDVELGPPGRFTPPDRFDPDDVLPADSLLMEMGDDAVARVWVDASAAGRVERLRGGEVAVRHPDGSVEVDVMVRNLKAFRGWVLGLRDHAEVLSPPEIRADVVAWLGEMAGRHA